MAVSSAPGLPRMAAPAGLTWKVLKAARSETARIVAGDYPQNWYDQGVAVDPNNPDRVFFDTFDVWFATTNGNSMERYDLRLFLQRQRRSGARGPACAGVFARLVQHFGNWE